jgi:hypothetical protein
VAKQSLDSPFNIDLEDGTNCTAGAAIPHQFWSTAMPDSSSLSSASSIPADDPSRELSVVESDGLGPQEFSITAES